MPEVPITTSTFTKEPIAADHVIPFAPELVNFILEKSKLRTYRYGRKYDYLQTGDEVGIQNVETKGILAKAEIVGKEYTTFAELPLDTEGHETYRDKEHQRQVFSGYYAYLGRPIEDEDEILVLDFRLVE